MKRQWGKKTVFRCGGYCGKIARKGSRPDEAYALKLQGPGSVVESGQRRGEGVKMQRLTGLEFGRNAG